jgi:hypothetical protein
MSLECGKSRGLATIRGEDRRSAAGYSTIARSAKRRNGGVSGPAMWLFWLESLIDPAVGYD